jgi:hypothetical protein
VKNLKKNYSQLVLEVLEIILTVLLKVLVWDNLNLLMVQSQLLAQVGDVEKVEEIRLETLVAEK